MTAAAEVQRAETSRTNLPEPRGGPPKFPTKPAAIGSRASDPSGRGSESGCAHGFRARPAYFTGISLRSPK